MGNKGVEKNISGYKDLAVLMPLIESHKALAKAIWAFEIKQRRTDRASLLTKFRKRLKDDCIVDSLLKPKGTANVV